jgi:acyl carrier protein
MSIKEKLKRVIIETLNLEGVTPDQIKDDDLLFGDKFGLDSIDAVEIVFQVDHHFGVKIRDMKEGRPALQSINTLAAFIEARR